MPFSFLNPWFWLGALAVAAPLWLHLRRRRETNLIQFSAVRFLEEQPEPRRAPLRLRNLVLLALRILALLTLVAAFAWPYLRSVSTAPIRESRVYILDNTLSRQAKDGFARDRDRLAAEVNRTASDIQVAVIELTANPRVVIAFGDPREQAAERVRQLEPSFERGSYLAAFRLANSLLGNSLGEQKRLVLLGDNQENQWTENVSSPPFLRQVKVELPDVREKTLPNLWLSEPRVQRMFLGDKSLAHFTVKLSHVGEARSAEVTIRANGQTVMSQEVSLVAQPETILLQAQWEAEPAEWLRGEASVEGTPDALPADNRAYFALSPVVEGKVALLAQSLYLRMALSPEVMRGQWAVRVVDPAALGSEAVAEPSADVLCLESGYLQSADGRKLLWRYLQSGRGVVLTVNRVTPTIKEALSEIGLETEGATEGAGSEKLQFVYFNHPVFHPFLSPDYGNLMEVKVAKYTRFKPGQALPLVFSEKGAALFYQSTAFPGRLYVTAFGLDREHTTWPVHQSFIPFLDLVLQAARAQDMTSATFEPGELALIPLRAGSAAREMVLHDGERELTRALVEQGRAQVQMPDKPGLYSVVYDDRREVEQILSVNPSPKESQLVYAETPEVLKAWQSDLPGETARVANAEGPSRMRPASILQQRVWWWLVLGGLAALVLETGFAGGRRERA